MVAAVVDVRRHLSLHLFQHLERGAAAEGLDGMLPIDVELLLQQALALHALLHALRVLAVHQLVLHMDEQLQDGDRPLLLLGRRVRVLVDVVMRDVVRDAVDERDLSVLSAGRDELVHDSARHLHVEMLGIVSSHRAHLRIDGNAQALLDEQARRNLGVNVRWNEYLDSGRAANAAANRDVGDKNHVKTQLAVRHVGQIEVANSLEVVAPFSLRSALQILVTVKLDHLSKGLRVHTAALGA